MTYKPHGRWTSAPFWIAVACCACSACRPSTVSQPPAAAADKTQAASTDTAPAATTPETGGTQHRPAQSSNTTAFPAAVTSTTVPPSSAAAVITNVIRSTRTPQDEIDPHRDGWDTEVLSDRLSSRLDQLGEFLIAASPDSTSKSNQVAAADIHGGPLIPSHLEVIYRDKTLEIRSGVRDSDAAFQGRNQFHQALQDYAELWQDAVDVTFKFKLFRVLRDETLIRTIANAEFTGLTTQGSRQHNATWQCAWRLRDAADPELVSVTVKNFTEAVVRSDHLTWFSDCTLGLLGDLDAYQNQLRWGNDDWRARLEAYFGIYIDGHHGLAIGDVNGDLLDDVYVCEPGGLPNRLFQQTSEGRLVDISAGAGVDFLEYSPAALLADLDNDGDQDLVVAVKEWIFFFANDGLGHFERRCKVPMPGQTAYSICAADIEGDGDLDVYTASYFGSDTDETNRLPSPLPYHDARSGGRNHLYRNQGEWSFEDATDQVGLNHNNDRWSFAAAFEDYDNDGDQDLYVANDFGRNNLYRNEQGQFADVAAEAHAEDINFGMSTTFGDYNRDGWMDIYVSNMFSSAGGRITFESRFQEGAAEDLKRIYQNLARGNTLLENHGGEFRDVSVDAQVTMGRWAWGSLFADVNNDGWEDLLVANGYITGQFPNDL